LFFYHRDTETPQVAQRVFESVVPGKEFSFVQILTRRQVSMPDVTDNLSEQYARLFAVSATDLVFSSDEAMIRLYDERLKALARDIGCFVTVNTSITLSSGQAAYGLPDRHIATIRVSLPTGVLYPASTMEIEARDSDFMTTTGTPTHWYNDKTGINLLRLYPLPNVSGGVVTVVYFEYPQSLDADGFNTVIPTPNVVGDLLDYEVLSELYAQESDVQMPESAKQLRELSKLVREVLFQYYGSSQI
jgi:hypothetical protein